MMRVAIESVGLAAPGLPGWAESQAVLRGEAQYEYADMPKYAPQVLPPNERRRATALTRLAFQVAEDATRDLQRPLSDLAAVFACSGGDTHVMDHLCRTLATEDRAISPTYFHNSVHNAPAGYWSIATGSMHPSTALCAHDASFAEGLREAVSMSVAEQVPVLLVAYDAIPPEPLLKKRPLSLPFGAAMVLNAQIDSSNSLARLELLSGQQERQSEQVSCLPDETLETMRLGNPIARSLPLLVAIAKAESGRYVLPDVDGLSLAAELSV